tara:strand:- start:290 stop:475 length:186 start_codon:yes stop_codon:yes gene_type:complete
MKNMKKLTKNDSSKRLAALVYDKALRKQIEERVSSKYIKRIEYLVGANNELMKKLEQSEEN